MRGKRAWPSRFPHDLRRIEAPRACRVPPPAPPSVLSKSTIAKLGKAGQENRNSGPHELRETLRCSCRMPGYGNPSGEIMAMLKGGPGDYGELLFFGVAGRGRVWGCDPHENPRTTCKRLAGCLFDRFPPKLAPRAHHLGCRPRWWQVGTQSVRGWATAGRWRRCRPITAAAAEGTPASSTCRTFHLLAVKRLIHPRTETAQTAQAVSCAQLQS